LEIDVIKGRFARFVLQVLFAAWVHPNFSTGEVSGMHRASQIKLVCRSLFPSQNDSVGLE